eukprot:scaffold10141_cov60-Cyclotella_meneghiniana.AAC.3
MMQLDLAIQKLWQVEATGQPDPSGCALLTHMAWMVATMMQLSVSRKYYGKLRQPGNLMQVDVRCSHTLLMTRGSIFHVYIHFRTSSLLSNEISS